MWLPLKIFGDRERRHPPAGRRGLQPLCLSGSAEGAGKGRRGHSSASDVRGFQLDVPQDRRSSV